MKYKEKAGYEFREYKLGDKVKLIDKKNLILHSDDLENDYVYTITELFDGNMVVIRGNSERDILVKSQRLEHLKEDN